MKHSKTHLDYITIQNGPTQLRAGPLNHIEVNNNWLQLLCSNSSFRRFLLGSFFFHQFLLGEFTHHSFW